MNPSTEPFLEAYQPEEDENLSHTLETDIRTPLANCLQPTHTLDPQPAATEAEMLEALPGTFEETPVISEMIPGTLEEIPAISTLQKQDTQPDIKIITQLSVEELSNSIGTLFPHFSINIEPYLPADRVTQHGRPADYRVTICSSGGDRLEPFMVPAGTQLEAIIDQIGQAISGKK